MKEIKAEEVKEVEVTTETEVATEEVKESKLKETRKEYCKRCSDRTGFGSSLCDRIKSWRQR